MEAFFRDTLKKQLKAVKGHVCDTGGDCHCYQFMGEVADCKRQLSEWRVACPAAITDHHKCLCYITEDQPLFGSLIEGCKVQGQLGHDCTCGTIVVPSQDMISRTGDSSARSGHLLCRSLHHACICRKVSSVECRAKTHDCVCENQWLTPDSTCRMVVTPWKKHCTRAVRCRSGLNGWMMLLLVGAGGFLLAKATC